MDNDIPLWALIPMVIFMCFAGLCWLFSNRDNDIDD